jgi:hypothetical protein
MMKLGSMPCSCGEKAARLNHWPSMSMIEGELALRITEYSEHVITEHSEHYFQFILLITRHEGDVTSIRENMGVYIWSWGAGKRQTEGPLQCASSSPA